MALPRKDDPRRPLHLAIRSSRLLGILLLLLGSCAFTPILFGRGLMAPGMSLLAFASLLIYVVPGVAYLVFAIFLKERKFWAVVATLVLAAIHLLLTLAGALAATVATFISKAANTTPLLIASGVSWLFVLALGQLVFHLARSFEAIKFLPPEVQRGFEPIMAQPIPPTATEAPMPGRSSL